MAKWHQVAPRVINTPGSRRIQLVNCTCQDFGWCPFWVRLRRTLDIVVLEHHVERHTLWLKNFPPAAQGSPGSQQSLSSFLPLFLPFLFPSFLPFFFSLPLFLLLPSARRRKCCQYEYCMQVDVSVLFDIPTNIGIHL